MACLRRGDVAQVSNRAGQNLDLVQNLAKMPHKTCPRYTVCGRAGPSWDLPADARGLLKYI